MHVGVFTTCTPFVVADRLCFLEYNTMQRYSTPVDRITWVGAQSNAEFSSPLFKMPARALTVNLQSGSGTLLPRPGLRDGGGAATGRPRDRRL